MTLEPPRDERERVHGGRVQPLHVIHCDDDRSLPRGLEQQRAHGSRDSPRLRPALRAGLAQQRDLERLALERGQSRQKLVGRVPDQVAQPDERQPRFGFLACAAQHATAAYRRLLERREPYGRLADPGLALDDERSRTGAHSVEEGPRESQLVVAPDDAAVHAAARLSGAALGVLTGYGPSPATTIPDS
jgi:hypothetical protein